MAGIEGWFFPGTKLGRLLVAGFASLAAGATTRRIASSRSVVYFVLLFASNLFYPLEPLPKWFRGPALANPITWQIDCLRWATIGVGNAQRVAMESIAFTVFAVAGFLYAARCLQRQQ